MDDLKNQAAAVPPASQNSAVVDVTCWWCHVVNTGPMVCNVERTIAMCGPCAQKVTAFLCGAVPPASAPRPLLEEFRDYILDHEHAGVWADTLARLDAILDPPARSAEA